MVYPPLLLGYRYHSCVHHARPTTIAGERVRLRHGYTFSRIGPISISIGWALCGDRCNARGSNGTREHFGHSGQIFRSPYDLHAFRIRLACDFLRPRKSMALSISQVSRTLTAEPICRIHKTLVSLRPNTYIVRSFLHQAGLLRQSG